MPKVGRHRVRRAVLRLSCVIGIEFSNIGWTNEGDAKRVEERLRGVLDRESERSDRVVFLLLLRREDVFCENGVIMGPMSKSRNQILQDSKMKAVKAGVVTAGSVALAAASFPILATVTAVPAVVLAWQWWKHRAENGIRF